MRTFIFERIALRASMRSMVMCCDLTPKKFRFRGQKCRSCLQILQHINFLQIKRAIPSSSVLPSVHFQKKSARFSLKRYRFLSSTLAQLKLIKNISHIYMLNKVGRKLELASTAAIMGTCIPFFISKKDSWRSIDLNLFGVSRLLLTMLHRKWA